MYCTSLTWITIAIIVSTTFITSSTMTIATAIFVATISAFLDYSMVYPFKKQALTVSLLATESMLQTRHLGPEPRHVP